MKESRQQVKLPKQAHKVTKSDYEKMTVARPMHTLWQVSLAIFLCISMPSLANPGGAVIYSLFPIYGSLGGNTEITILGAGFQRTNLSGMYVAWGGFIF